MKLEYRKKPYRATSGGKIQYATLCLKVILKRIWSDKSDKFRFYKPAIHLFGLVLKQLDSFHEKAFNLSHRSDILKRDLFILRARLEAV